MTELGITTDVSPLHPQKAAFPILVTELGSTTNVSPLHVKKAPSSILMTESGITIDVSPVHSEKAANPHAALPSPNLKPFFQPKPYLINTRIF